LKEELSKGKRIYLGMLLAWLLLTDFVVLLLNWPVPRHRAVILMATGLILLWVFGCGSLMHKFRDRISTFVQAVRLDWRLKFVLFCTLLAMLEEAVTTGMTNCAPLFGVHIGQAYITASANYFDVICLHSVVIFISLFVGWAVILSRYDFSPYSVFIIFGITGTLAEMGYGGPQHALEYAMWSFVYGLMIWLPARSIPKERGARSPSWWLYPLAVVLPYLFILLFPLAGVVSLFFPGHPRVHFPPLG
jgi:hypothetical protein